MRALAILCMLLSLAFPDVVRAAEFTVVDGDDGWGKLMYLAGPVEDGDFERFSRAIRKAGPDVQGLELRSTGGNVFEALRIGRLLRSLFLDTRAPLQTDFVCPRDSEKLGRKVPCECTSACFLIWLAGVDRIGEELFMHRFFLPRAYFAKLPPDEADSLYRRIQTQTKDYFDEMGVPSALFDRMLAIHSGRVEKLDEDTAMSLMVGLPSFQEWIASNCDSVEGDCISRKRFDARRSAFSKVLK
jgi:hypothetical protein